MPWFKVDDGLSTKLETTRIPRAHRAAAMGLWALAGSWSARELTDGHIPAHMIDELAGTPEDAQRLVDAGFWRAVDDGFQFVVWEGEQPMRAKVIEAREKNSAKVQAWRERNRVTNPETNHDETPPPTRPDPTSSDEEKNTPPAARQIEDAFGRAYEAWPRKTEKRRSLQAFTRAAKKRTVDELVADIIRFGQAYAATTEKQFTPALSAWLNGERWEDELPAPALPTQEQWDAFLSSSSTTTTICEAGRHRWLADGTCNLCPARQDRIQAGAA